MKKEYFWFLILILAAAVITGSTLGMITNFKYISQQSKIRLQENKAVETKAIKLNNSSSPKQTQAVNNEPVSTDSAPQQLAANGASDTTIMLVSQTEKDEFDAMLNAVESNHGADYSARIKSFQEKHALPITGVMDSQTLSILINQATLQRSIQHLSN